jgi:uncharacterized membrane protein YphA (DoxX/SURF4 family)
MWALTLVRIFCGLTFLVASVDKLGEPALFAEAIENYHIVPRLFVPLAAVVVPWLEFLTGLSLCFGWRWRSAALVYVALLMAYSVGLAVNLLRGVEMSCGCFSLANTAPATWLTVFRDLLLLLPGLWVLSADRTYLAFPSNPREEEPVPEKILTRGARRHPSAPKRKQP